MVTDTAIIVLLSVLAVPVAMFVLFCIGRALSGGWHSAKLEYWRQVRKLDTEGVRHGKEQE